MFVTPGGDVYVADQGNRAVKRVPAGSNTPVTFLGSLNGPYGVYVSTTGEVWIADTPRVLRVSTAMVVTIITGFTAPSAVHVTVNGDAYVTDYTTTVGFLKRIAAGTTTVTTLISSNLWTMPNGLFITLAGDIYIADYNSGTWFIAAGTTGGTASVLRFPTPGSANTVSLSAAGDIYIAGNYGFFRYAAGTTTNPTTVSATQGYWGFSLSCASSSAG